MDILHKKYTTFSCRESCLQEGQLELLSLFLVALDYRAFDLLSLLLHSPTFSDRRQTLGSDQNLGRIPNTSFSFPLFNAIYSLGGQKSMDRSLSSITYVSLQIANLYNHVLIMRSQLALALERSTSGASTTHLGRFIFQVA